MPVLRKHIKLKLEISLYLKSEPKKAFNSSFFLDAVYAGNYLYSGVEKNSIY